MRRALVGLALGMLAACTEDPALAPLTLHLVDDAPACLAVQVAMVKSVEITALGTSAGGVTCQLDRACVEVSISSSLGALEDRLAAAPQPALDVETGRLANVQIRGYSLGGCAGDIQMCGIADTDAAAAEMLAVPMVCDGRIGTRCAATTLPLCP